MLGAAALKPTTLGLVHFSQLRTYIRALPYRGVCRKIGRLNACGHQHVSLKGTDPQGNFITAPFKQYTSDLNFAIALSAVTCWQQLDLFKRAMRQAADLERMKDDAQGFRPPPADDDQLGWCLRALRRARELPQI